MSDLAHILAGPAAAGQQHAGTTVTDTLDDAFRSHRGSQAKKAVAAAQPAKKKAKGMSREVYNLLGANALPPMVRPSPTHSRCVSLVSFPKPRTGGWRWRRRCPTKPADSP